MTIYQRIQIFLCFFLVGLFLHLWIALAYGWPLPPELKGKFEMLLGIILLMADPKLVVEQLHKTFTKEDKDAKTDPASDNPAS